MRGLAYRRHQRERWWRRTYLGLWARGLSEEDRLRITRRRHKNRKPCSCPMCRNRRWIEGPTVQERRLTPDNFSGLDEEEERV